MKAQQVINIVSSLLVVLFVYTAAAKWINLPSFRASLELQPFGKASVHWLVWIVPATETVTAILLLFHPTRLAGLLLSWVVLASFTFYASLVVWGFFPYTPCGCGGIVSGMSWTQHFLFNLTFWVLNTIALVLYRHQHKAAPEKILQSGVAEYL